MANKIRVLVADSSQIYALGLCRLLSKDKRIQVFNHIYSGRDVIDVIGRTKPDLVLIDSGLLDYDGITVLKMLKELYPEVRVIVLVPPENITSILDDAINAGAKGFLSRTTSPTELLNSIIDAAQVGATIHPALIPQIFNKLAAISSGTPVSEQFFSNREREIMELVARGKSNREIAQELFISENTAKGHIRRICYKLDIDNRVEITRYVMLENRMKYKSNSNNMAFSIKKGRVMKC